MVVLSILRQHLWHALNKSSGWPPSKPPSFSGGPISYHGIWGRILGRNWDKSLRSFPPCYSQSPLQMDSTPPPPPPVSKSGLKLVCNEKLYTETSSLRTLKIMPRNLSKMYVHEFGFWTINSSRDPTREYWMIHWWPDHAFSSRRGII